MYFEFLDKATYVKVDKFLVNINRDITKLFRYSFEYR